VQVRLHLRFAEERLSEAEFMLISRKIWVATNTIDEFIEEIVYEVLESHSSEILVRFAIPHVKLVTTYRKF
jgi:hypothetical protein